MPAAEKYRLLSFLFARKPHDESVATRVHWNVGAETVWSRLLFYEEVPGKPPLLLRTLLPRPVRTEGGKTRPGETVHCIYHGGELLKRITAVEPPHLVHFEVIKQRLGIEGCVLTLGGSYELHPCGDGTDLALRTNYRAYLRPRCLWRRVEALLVSQLHGHILRGVRAGLPVADRAVRAARADPLQAQRSAAGGFACTVSLSRFRR